MATPSKKVARNLLLILLTLTLGGAVILLCHTLWGDSPPIGTTGTQTTTVTTTVLPPSTVPPMLSPPSPSPTHYTVTILVDGKTTQKTVDTSVRTAPLPADPQKSGMTFIGWEYNDGVVKRPYHGEIIATNCIITARFAERAHTVRFAIGEGASALFTEKKTEHGYAVTDFPRVYKPNHTVSGWYLDAALTIPYDGSPITADTTLYPVYTDYVSGATTAIPKLSVFTEGAAPITSKDDYIRATLTLDGADCGDGLNAAGARIRGRGNSTWKFFDKKPYRIKLDTAADLLGLGKEKDFVLLANAGDPTMLHNYTYFGLAALLGDTVTSKARYVSLYINGEYRGMYLLCEQCEVGDARVPIDEGDSGLTDVGYLVEFGGNTLDPPKYSFTLNTVTSSDGQRHTWRQGFYATVKSPDVEIITPAQKVYIRDYTNRVNTAIFKGDYDTFASLCDVDSFVRGFIANMVMMNNDMDYSMYFYKPAGGKLTLGPLWDCDQAAGTSIKTGTTTEGLNVSRYEHWLTALYQMPQFATRVKNMWNAQYGHILDYIDEVAAMATTLRDDIDMNYTCHDTLGLPYWRIVPEHLGYTTYDEHLAFYLEWLDRRITWLDNYLNKEKSQ